jgi:hypothetical protein
VPVVAHAVQAEGDESALARLFFFSVLWVAAVDGGCRMAPPSAIEVDRAAQVARGYRAADVTARRRAAVGSKGV